MSPVPSPQPCADEVGVAVLEVMLPIVRLLAFNAAILASVRTSLVDIEVVNRFGFPTLGARLNGRRA